MAPAMVATRIVAMAPAMVATRIVAMATATVAATVINLKGNLKENKSTIVRAISQCHLSQCEHAGSPL